MNLRFQHRFKMIKKQSINPILRFPNYTEDWEHEKLSNLLVEHKVRNSSNKFKEVFSVAKNIGVVNQIQHLGRSYASDDISNYKVVFPDNVVYTKSPTSGFPFGIIKQNKLERTGVVSVLYAVFKAKNKEIGHLLEMYFSSEINTYNYLVPLVHRGAKNTMNISNTAFLNGSRIGMPINSEEQKKLVQFLNSVDNLILQLSEKKDSLNEYKKGIIQQVFKKNLRFTKKNGEKFPAWKSHSVKKILKRYSNPVKVKTNNHYKQIGIKSHGKGIFYKDAVTGESLGNKRVFWIQKDKLILNIVFAWERAISKTTINEEGMIASHRFPMYEPVKELLDLDFILYFFLTPAGKKLLELASPGGAGRNKTLGQTEFDKIKISLPILDEQIKISKFLQEIDKEINLISDRLEQTQLYKKGLLQKMFC